MSTALRAFLPGLTIAALAVPCGAFSQGASPQPQQSTNAATGQNAVAATPDRQSLFFTDDELGNVARARAIYQKKLESLASQLQDGAENTQTFLDQLDQQQNGVSKPATFVFPQFYLESLVFHSSDNWSIRINKTIIAPDALASGKPVKIEAESLTLTAVDKNTATFLWRPRQEVITRLADAWGPSSNAKVSVDKTGSAVTFSLHANQTFSSYDLNIVEGKMEPIAVDARQPPTADAAGLLNVQAPADDAGRAPPADPAAREGLNGLINSYNSLAVPTASR